jgi:FkbM family methyltransferase
VLNILDSVQSKKIKKSYFKKTPKKQIHIPVNVTNIDTFVGKEKIEIIDFLSIDTEGYDGTVILGMAKTLSKGHIRVFEFEYHSNPPWNKMVQ